jgi:hypothetical protein
MDIMLVRPHPYTGAEFGAGTSDVTCSCDSVERLNTTSLFRTLNLRFTSLCVHYSYTQLPRSHICHAL